MNEDEEQGGDGVGAISKWGGNRMVGDDDEKSQSILGLTDYCCPSAGRKAIQPNLAGEDNRQERWDKASVHDFSGTYGDYLLSKVSKVFSQLQRDVL